MRSNGINIFSCIDGLISSFLSFPPLCGFSLPAGPEEAKNLAGQRRPPDSDPFSDAEFAKNLA
jgi:hypothetical protein